MHALTFIARHIRYEPPSVDCDTICAITGEKITKGIHIDKAFGDLFNDYDCVRYSSDYVSPDFIKCTAKTINDCNASMRNFSYLCTETELKLLKREEVIDYLLNPPEPPFILAYSFNNKKHTTFKAKINYSKDLISVTTDSLGVIDVETSIFHEIYSIAQEWLTHTSKMKKDATFFSKTDILEGTSNIEKISIYGYDRFIQENKTLEKYRRTNLLTLIVRLLNIREI